MLYGLCQSAYEFYTVLWRCFSSIGMHCCKVDHAIISGTWTIPPHASIPALPLNVPLFVIIPVYIDNGLIVCNSLLLYDWIISELQKSIEIINMGEHFTLLHLFRAESTRSLSYLRGFRVEQVGISLAEIPPFFLFRVLAQSELSPGSVLAESSDSEFLARNGPS